MNTQLPTDIHNLMWNNESEKAVFIPVSMLKPKIFPDGNKWCVLYGDDVQEGITGFGDTPIAAIHDFNNNLYHQPPPPQP